MYRTIILFSLSVSLLCSCGSNTGANSKQEHAKADTAMADTTAMTVNEMGVAVPDSIPRLAVDGYRVTDAMFLEQRGGKSYLKKSSGQTISLDKTWFRNDSLGQVLMFDLATDQYRYMTFHFYNSDIPVDMISEMDLHVEGGELAPLKQKQKDLAGFVQQAKEIGPSYFITYKGFALGDTMQKAIDEYGQPDNRTITGGIEKLEWNFVGDELYDGREDLKGKPLAKESFGHSIKMYYRHGRLIAQTLVNDVL